LEQLVGNPAEVLASIKEMIIASYEAYWTGLNNQKSGK
jgi:hypothetical protein